MIKLFLSKQFLKFLAVGGTAALLHWISRIVLSLWLPFSWSVTVAYVIGMTVAFILNRIFVFPKSSKPIYRQARDFVLVNVGFFPLVWLAAISINMMLEQFNFVYAPQALAHGIAVSLPMIATFLIYKFFTFKELGHGKQ